MLPFFMTEELTMKFFIADLQKKTLDQIRDIFSEIPATESCIYLQGDFTVGKDVATALFYLPRHVSSVIFELEYDYYRITHSTHNHVTPSTLWTGTSALGTYNKYYKKIGNVLKDFIIALPKSIHSIEFIYNSDKTSNNYHNATDAKHLIDMFRYIKPTVSYLELNNLADLITEDTCLKQELLGHIPDTISKELPDQPSFELLKQEWPKSYVNMTQDKTSDKLQQAREILNDYTKGDSVLWRILCGHWNRHHVKDIARLIHYIDKGLISNIEELGEEFEQIQLMNETGSLARRYSFLHS